MTEDWMKANATLIFTKGKKDPGRYVPVSLTLIPGKVFGQLILQTILKFIKDKTIIRSGQHSFNKRKSCLTNLVVISDEVDARRAADFSETFDT